MYSFKSTDVWYEGRPVASASTPPNLRSARSSSSTNTSITRTGLSSQIQSSRHSGNSVVWLRSVPSTKRFIRSLRKSRRNHTLRITSLSTFLHNQDPQLTLSEPLLDHLVGAAEQRERHREAERLGRLHVDDQLDFRGLLDRQVSRLLALEDAADIDAGLVIRIGKIGSVAHQAACLGERPKLEGCGHRMADA